MKMKAATDAGEKSSDGRQAGGKKNSAIFKNEILLKRDRACYSEVRHIILKGTNEQIGRALGEISHEDYHVTPTRYIDPIYARARLAYMQKNYPVFYESMKGAADAYGISIEEKRT